MFIYILLMWDLHKLKCTNYKAYFLWITCVGHHKAVPPPQKISQVFPSLQRTFLGASIPLISFFQIFRSGQHVGSCLVPLPLALEICRPHTSVRSSLLTAQCWLANWHIQFSLASVWDSPSRSPCRCKSSCFAFSHTHHKYVSTFF